MQIPGGVMKVKGLNPEVKASGDVSGDFAGFTI
jgi:hypothetical protein